MRLKMILTVLVFGAVIPASCQVVSQATDTSGTPLTIGVGYSNYYSNWNGRLSGPVIWADWTFYGKRSYLHGFGVELEARDLNYGRTGSVPNLRMDTATGGVIYTCRRFRKINPYAKYLAGLGSIDFISTNPNYKHDTRTISSWGGGLRYRVSPQVWVNADYEYQFWPQLPRDTLNPQGFTIGIAYDFRRVRREIIGEGLTATPRR
jgi:opacity protein-like surface antigen